MAEDGADILDLGAESTRPGAPRVPEEQERERMSAAVAAIRRELPHMPLSIDTTRASVAEAALENGADVLNDVSGLQFDNGIAEAAARHKAMLVLMHMRGTPQTMQTMTRYDDLTGEVLAYFVEKIGWLRGEGVTQIVRDPGFGFSKTVEQNFRPQHLPHLHLHGHQIIFHSLIKFPIIMKILRPNTQNDIFSCITAVQKFSGTVCIHLYALPVKRKPRSTALPLYSGFDKIHSRRTNKSCHKFIYRILIKIRRCSHLLNHTGFHHHDPCSQRHGLHLIMGHIDGGGSQIPVELADLRPHADAQLGVQTR